MKAAPALLLLLATMAACAPGEQPQTWNTVEWRSAVNKHGLTLPVFNCALHCIPDLSVRSTPGARAGLLSAFAGYGACQTACNVA